MKENVSDFLVRRLSEWGVKRIFGYPGDGINGVFGALNRAADKIDYVQVRHEETAAFMACAHAKFTGEVGVCVATSGPGAIHLLNGLYDAKLDHQPVVAIADQPEQVGDAWERALNADRPVLLEAYVDPDVPPLPPHITFKQAKAYASAILKGDTDSMDIIKASMKQIF